MLEVKHITKYYGKNRAVNNLSFTVKDGEIFGLLGENGAGKTTTFRIIMGLIDSNEGEVLLDGKKIDYNLTDKIGFVTEERSLLTKLTVLEQLTFYGVLKGLDERTIEKEIDKWLEKFEISSYKNRKIKELSKGNQQKIQFISAIINHPKLLILDEPTSGLDPIVRKEILDIFLDFIENGENSILFSSHITSDIEAVADYIIFIDNGKLVFDKEKDDILDIYGIVKCNDSDFEKVSKEDIISYRKNKYNYEVLVTDRKKIKKNNSNLVIDKATLEDIMLLIVKGEK